MQITKCCNSCQKDFTYEKTVKGKPRLFCEGCKIVRNKANTKLSVKKQAGRLALERKSYRVLNKLNQWS